MREKERKREYVCECKYGRPMCVYEIERKVEERRIVRQKFI